MTLLPSSPRVLAVAVHGSLLATLCAPAMANQIVADGTHQTVGAGNYDDSAPLYPFSGVFYAMNGGSIDAATGADIVASGSFSHGAFADGPGSSITLAGGRVTVTGSSSAGLASSGGGLIDARNLMIDKQGTGQGVFADGAGSEVRLRDSQIVTVADKADGVYVRNGAAAELSNVQINTRGKVAAGINANLGAPILHLQNVQVLTEGDQSSALWSISGIDIEGSDVSFQTVGNDAAAVDVRGGKTRLQASVLATQGRGSHGLLAWRSPSAPSSAEVGLEDVDIQTRGDLAFGMLVQSAAQVDAQRGQVRTSGEGSHGVFVADASSRLALTGTVVATEGEGAQAARIAGGRFEMQGGSLHSAKDAAIGISGAASLDLRGAQLQGGNGELLAVEAAATGPIDVTFGENTQAFGDIVRRGTAAPGGASLVLSLGRGALWQGATGIVDTLALGQGSQWNVTGDSTLGNLQLDGGTVAFAGSTFNTVTVDGNYTGNNGTVLFNTRLEGDGAPSDRVHVKGDTSGHTNVGINSVGGGAETGADGIQIVQVDGRSDGDFVLQGRAVGGSHEYFLHKGGVAAPGDGNWYLRSAVGTTPPPGPGPDPAPDPDPAPVLRPEPGAYWANQTSVMAMFEHRLQDRLGGRVPHPGDQQRGAWANVKQQQDDFHLQGGQLKIDSRRSNLQVGTDFFGNETLRAGVMLGQGSARNQSRSIVTGYEAQGKVEGSTVGLYASWLDPSEDQSGFQFDSWVQWGRFKQSVQGTALAPEHYRATGTAASVELGYAVPWQLGEYTVVYVEPQLQVNYTDYRMRDHIERNGTVVASRGAGGVTTRAGVKLYGRSGSPGPHVQQHNWVQPYLAVNWLTSNHASDALRFDGQAWDADVGGRQMEAKVGVQLQLSPRLNGWGEFGVETGSDRYRGVGGQLGLRYAW